jgi:hypothetical protein
MMLAPALVLVVLSLGALAVDTVLVEAARRTAFGDAAAAADDAAAMLDGRRLLLGGEVTVDPSAAEAVVQGHLAALDRCPSEARWCLADVTTSVDADAATVTVAVRLEVDHIFLDLVGDDASAVTATATGRLES